MNADTYNTDPVLSHISLRFNVEHPTLEECYAHGYENASANLSESDNPFSANTREREAWADGWWDGFYGEDPLFEAYSIDDEEKRHNDYPAIAANADDIDSDTGYRFFLRVLRITGAIALSAVIGYQLMDMVA